jgi:hypothetical protein
MSDYDTWLSTNPNDAYAEKEMAQNLECDCSWNGTLDVEVSLSRYSMNFVWDCPDCGESHEEEGDYSEDDYIDSDPTSEY